MTDEELLSAFESCTLDHRLWTHRAHVRIACVYATRHPLRVAIDRMRQSIKAYNAAQQIPEGLESGYHETITVAFMRVIHNTLRHSRPLPNSDAFCDRNPELLKKALLRKFYSRERIVTLEAKQIFVEPDLLKLPPNDAPELLQTEIESL